MIVSSNWKQAHDFACHSKACAPPPVGEGGSEDGPGSSTAKKNAAMDALRPWTKKTVKNDWHNKPHDEAEKARAKKEAAMDALRPWTKPHHTPEQKALADKQDRADQARLKR